MVVRESERCRVMARNSEKEREVARRVLWWPERVTNSGRGERRRKMARSSYKEREGVKGAV